MDCRETCPIVSGGFCDRHLVKKTAHWVRLCRTRANYWTAWEEHHGPGQADTPPRRAQVSAAPRLEQVARYLRCAHRGDVLQEVSARAVGCGCGSSRVQFFVCRQFGEPCLKDCKDWAWRANADRLRSACPGFRGLICRTCRVAAEAA